MLKNISFDDSCQVLVFLFNFERKKDSLKNIYPSKHLPVSTFIDIACISKVLNITYPHTAHIIYNSLFSNDLINVDKLSRSSLISLTEKGIVVAEKLDSIFNDLNIKRIKG